MCHYCGTCCQYRCGPPTPTPRVATVVSKEVVGMVYEYAVVRGLVYVRVGGTGRKGWRLNEWTRPFQVIWWSNIPVHGFRCGSLEDANLAVRLFAGAGDVFPD